MVIQNAFTLFFNDITSKVEDFLQDKLNVKISKRVIKIFTYFYYLFIFIFSISVFSYIENQILIAFTNLVPVTIGNIIGGVMVGLFMWYCYLKKHH